MYIDNKKPNPNDLNSLVTGLNDDLGRRCQQAINTAQGTIRAGQFTDQYYAVKNNILLRERDIQQNDEEISTLRESNASLQYEIDLLRKEIEEVEKPSNEMLSLQYIIQKTRDENEKQFAQSQLDAHKRIQAEYKSKYQSQIDKNTKTIEQNNYDIIEFKNFKEELISEQSKDLDTLNALDAQIANTQETTGLQRELIDCKARLEDLQKLASDEAIKKEQAAIKSRMKDIIKEMIHSEMIDKLKEELNKESDPEKVKKLEAQISKEARKTDLRKKLKEAQEEFKKVQKELKEAQEQLKKRISFGIGKTGIQNCEKGITKLQEQIAELQKKIAKRQSQIAEITMESRSLLPVDPAEAAKLIATTSATTITVTPSTVETVMNEFTKWLNENMWTEASKGDIQEVIVTAVLLYFTNKKFKATTSSGEEDSRAAKIKKIAMGACEKFCMGQVLQCMIAANPSLSFIYGFGLIAKHFVVDDAQLSTLVQKVKGFMIGEGIKFAGIALLGGVMGTAAAPVLAVSAAFYTAYNMLNYYYYGSSTQTNEETTSETEEVIEPSAPSAIQGVADAGLDLAADTAVEFIWGQITGAAATALS